MIRLWDLTTQQELSPLVGHTAQITSIAFSPKDPLIASASAPYASGTPTAPAKNAAHHAPTT